MFDKVRKKIVKETGSVIKDAVKNEFLPTDANLLCDILEIAVLIGFASLSGHGGSKSNNIRIVTDPRLIQNPFMSTPLFFC